MNCLNFYDELRTAGTKSEFYRMVNDFCETLRTELTKMGFKFEEHPDKGIRGGQRAINETESQYAKVYCDFNAMRLNQSDRKYGKWLSDKSFEDLINFNDHLPKYYIIN